MMKIFKKIKRLVIKIIFRVAEPCFSWLGFHLIPKHFYQPVPEQVDLNDHFFQTNSELVGVDINEKAVLNYLDTGIVPMLQEFRRLFPLYEKNRSYQEQFYLINGAYMAIDAHVYYATLRHLKPKRIIEIGGGNSSLLAVQACKENQAQDAKSTRLTIIDPYPEDKLKEALTGVAEVIEKKVQDVDLAFFSELEAKDVLFIDSSHVLRSGGDVQYEYLEILPRLRSGVFVHIHDISLPKPYPKVYADNKLFWNEQYLLQAFLAFNSKFEIVWPGNYMMIKFPDKIQEIFPEFQEMRKHFPQSEPSGFWMKVR